MEILSYCVRAGRIFFSPVPSFGCGTPVLAPGFGSRYAKLHHQIMPPPPPSLMLPVVSESGQNGSLWLLVS